jgi:hypothetical protein
MTRNIVVVRHQFASTLAGLLIQLSDSVPPRDLDLSDRLEDEPLALGYLLLLGEYGVSKIVEPN